MNTIPDITFEYLLGAVPIWGKPNIWYGSVTYKENTGVFDDRFRYRLTVKVDEENGNKISASYYVGWQSYDIVDKEKITEEFFPADDEGTAQAINWLREQLETVSKM